MKYDSIVRSIFVLVIIMSSRLLFAQEECVMCHSDDTLTKERKGHEISLFVDEDKFSNSVHGGLECIDCHEGFNDQCGQF